MNNKQDAIKLLLEPMKEVLRISDRKHDAWDAAKAAIEELSAISEQPDDAEYRGYETTNHGLLGIETHYGKQSAQPSDNQFMQDLPDCTGLVPPSQAVAPAQAAWTVRDNPEESGRDGCGLAFDVMLPSGGWQTCHAISPTDARECIRGIWEDEQKRLEEYAAPQPKQEQARDSYGDHLDKLKGSK